MTDAIYKKTAISSRAQPWLLSPAWDGTLIILPAFLTSIAALCCGHWFNNDSSLPLWAWVSLILLCDVAHVYATLFRTYLDPMALAKNKGLLIGIPMACWLVGCLLYTLGALLFWRALAYLAVFHFVRQQYGFMALYSRKDSPAQRKYQFIDALAIYAATGFPLLYWHVQLPRNFNWFVPGDFFEFGSSISQSILAVGFIVYAAIACIYLVKEVIALRASGFINVPKNLIIISTAVSWWIGIVSFNSDLIFTMTNVISHGIPYMALVWLYHGKHSSTPPPAGSASKRDFFLRAINLCLRHAPLFIGLLWLLAYLEEGFWDGLVWREHLRVFLPFNNLPTITDPSVLALLVPLLSLPQSTHYVLDGFIWRVKDRNSIWSA